MIWLTCQEGLPLAAWRMRLNHLGECNLCSQGALETPEHSFFSCPSVSGVWEKVRRMRKLAMLPARIDSWWAALTGIYDPWGSVDHSTRPPTLATLVSLGGVAQSNTHRITTIPASTGAQVPPQKIDETLWEVLQCCLIWFLWCKKVAFDLWDGDFHIGVALFRAWQTTVQAGMGAWMDLTKYSSQQKSEQQMLREKAFLKTWSHGNLFCSIEKGLHWNLAPHRDFLPRDLANRYKQFRSGLTQPRPHDIEEDNNQIPSHLSWGISSPLSSPHAVNQSDSQRLNVVDKCII